MKRTIPVCLWIAAALPAQIVSSSITALTPIVTQVNAGGQTAQSVQVAGALPDQGSTSTQQVVAGAVPAAMAGWSTAFTDSLHRVSIVHQLESGGVVPSNLSIAQHELVVRFTATAPVPVELELERWSEFGIGAPMPQVAVDLGNDGTIDIVNAPVWQSIYQPAVLDPSGYEVRVIMSSTVQGPDDSTTSFRLTARPDNALDIALDAVGCAQPGGPAFVHVEPTPVFADRGVVLLLAGGQLPSVAVFGLGQQPILLPSTISPSCLLTPSPDVVLAIQAGIPLRLQLPLPATVRPVTLRSQAVALTPSGFVTTDAYRVHAF